MCERERERELCQSTTVASRQLKLDWPIEIYRILYFDANSLDANLSRLLWQYSIGKSLVTAGLLVVVVSSRYRSCWTGLSTTTVAAVGSIMKWTYCKKPTSSVIVRVSCV